MKAERVPIKFQATLTQPMSIDWQMKNKQVYIHLNNNKNSTNYCFLGLGRV